MTTKYYVFRVPMNEGIAQYQRKLAFAQEAIRHGIPAQFTFDRMPASLRRYRGNRMDKNGMWHVDFEPYPYGGAVIAVDQYWNIGLSVCSMADKFNIYRGQGLAEERIARPDGYDFYTLLYSCPDTVQASYYQLLRNRRDAINDLPF